MNRMKRLPFPRYLNRSKLWIYFEEDEILVAFGVMIVGIALTFIFTVPPYIAVAIVAFMVWIAGKMYKKFKRNSVKGYLNHLFYTAGYRNIKDSEEKGHCRFRVPYGFATKFKN